MRHRHYPYKQWVTTLACSFSCICKHWPSGFLENPHHLGLCNWREGIGSCSSKRSIQTLWRMLGAPNIERLQRPPQTPALKRIRSILFQCEMVFVTPQSPAYSHLSQMAKCLCKLACSSRKCYKEYRVEAEARVDKSALEASSLPSSGNLKEKRDTISFARLWNLKHPQNSEKHLDLRGDLTSHFSPTLQLTTPVWLSCDPKAMPAAHTQFGS